MNRDQYNGRIMQAKSKAKEVTGKIVGDKRLEENGKVQTSIAKVQTEYGDLKDEIK